MQESCVSGTIDNLTRAYYIVITTSEQPYASLPKREICKLGKKRGGGVDFVDLS